MANTLEALQSLHQNIANVTADVDRLIAHRDALALECKSLREALRSRTVFDQATISHRAEAACNVISATKHGGAGTENVTLPAVLRS